MKSPDRAGKFGFLPADQKIGFRNEGIFHASRPGGSRLSACSPSADRAFHAMAGRHSVSAVQLIKRGSAILPLR